MINRLKTLENNKKRLLTNFFSLSILQGTNYLLPLTTFPYLVRVLGPEKFGLVTFAQAFIQYFVILTDYGFNLSATREISTHRENKARVAEIFCSVMCIKLALLAVSFGVLSVVVFGFSRFRVDWEVYFLTFGIVFGQMLFPVWFFQGMEQMKCMAVLNIFAKLIFISCVFIFVKQQNDYVYVPLLNSVGFLASGLLGFFTGIRQSEATFAAFACLKNLSKLKYYFNEATKFFFAVFFAKIFASSGVFFAGIFLGNSTAGLLGAVEKMTLAFSGLFKPISESLYPFFTRKQDKSVIVNRYFRVVLRLSGVFLVLSVLIYFFSNDIVILVLGHKFTGSVPILKYLSPIFFISPLYILFGYHVFLSLGKDREFMLTVIVPVLFFFSTSLPVLFFFKSLYLFLVIIVMSRAIVLIMRLSFLIKFRKEMC